MIEVVQITKVDWDKLIQYHDKLAQLLLEEDGILPFLDPVTKSPEILEKVSAIQADVMLIAKSLLVGDRPFGISPLGTD